MAVLRKSSAPLSVASLRPVFSTRLLFTQLIAGFPEFIKKAIYTTNAIEAINRQIRKIIKNKAQMFPNDDAVKKSI